MKRVENSNPAHVQVVLGDQNLGAVVWLLKENNAYRIDDIRFIMGPDEMRDQVQLKRHVRLLLAAGSDSPTVPGAVVPATLEVIDEELFPESLGSQSPVRQATGSTSETTPQ